MAKRVELFFLSFVVAMFAFTVSVRAQEANQPTGEQPVTTTSTQEESTTSDEVMQTTAADESTGGDAVTSADEREAKRTERLEAYKAKMVERLAQFQEARIIARCKATQGLITSLRARLSISYEARRKVYSGIPVKLDTLVAKLQAADMDTKTIETAREAVKTELATLTENLTAYELSLEDLEVMDCESDPNAFKAALDTARELQITLKVDAQEFKLFTTTELKTILQDLKTQLEAKQLNTTEATTDTMTDPASSAANQTTDTVEGN